MANELISNSGKINFNNLINLINIAHINNYKTNFVGGCNPLFFKKKEKYMQ